MLTKIEAFVDSQGKMVFDQSNDCSPDPSWSNLSNFQTLQVSHQLCHSLAMYYIKTMAIFRKYEKGEHTRNNLDCLK